MTRLMYDGINTDIAYIPTTAELVAGYIDGLYAWSDSDWAHFPNSVHVQISVDPHNNAGQVQDVEQGNGTIQEAVDWVLNRRASGYPFPTIYCSMSNWTFFQDVFTNAGVAQPLWWVADYNYKPATVPDGMVGFQYQDYQELYDLSIVVDHWPGVDPVPVPPTPPKPQYDFQEESVAVSIDGNAGIAWKPGTVKSVIVVCDPGFNSGAVLRPVIWGPAGPEVLQEIAVSSGKGSYTVHFDLNNQWVDIAGITVTTAAPANGGAAPNYYLGIGDLA